MAMRYIATIRNVRTSSGRETMPVSKVSFALGALLLCSLAPAAVWAKNVVKFGDYDVHYNALRTDVLTPEIAQAYQLTRRNNRAMVNITVQKRGADGKTTPHKAKVDGFASNLTAQIKNLENSPTRSPLAL